MSMERKKQRWYKREVKRIVRTIDNFYSVFNPLVNEPFSDEYFKIYANLFFKPKGKDRTEIFQHLIGKTEEMLMSKPEDIGFCKIILAVYEENFSHSQILIFYESSYYNTFWDRKDIRYQKWSKVNKGSLIERLNMITNLAEVGYLEEV
ncbi:MULTISPECIES: DUF3916 domain-containing protein [unclassified Clostridium]|uniref:DUF3916 domain-containing protein n=1 Tax=unclassified Clostridium TaxID=2614128 RepID=UPI0002984D70|nr:MULTISPECIES: DUF3916 domain-containing protein [unclassified Clostridium]EKQ57613.1 MAG: hypothetical protein A370_00745 [Clostridium sp. Maddingley MBC34-26]